MNYQTQNTVFEYQPNTLLAADLTVPIDEQSKMNRDNLQWPEYEKLDSLEVISGLYIYTNTPPVAYRTPAPKDAESVTRAYRYNMI